MSIARRSLPTAAAGALLAALWFVPSAHATADLAVPAGAAQAGAAERHASGATGTSTGSDAPAASASGATHARPAGDGSHTTPYLIGGTLVLGLGAGFVAYSVRQERGARAS